MGMSHINYSWASISRKYTLHEVFTAAEAESAWCLKPGTIRSSCTRGPLKGYVEIGMVRQSGKVWLVTREAMEEVYGNLPSGGADSLLMKEQ